MPNPKGLPISEAVRFGWKTVQSSFAFILLTLVVAAIVPSIIEWGGEHVFHHAGQIFLIKVISALVSATFGLGLSKIYLRFRGRRKTDLRKSLRWPGAGTHLVRLHVHCHRCGGHGADLPDRPGDHHDAASFD